jgi:hypothetical protein
MNLELESKITVGDVLPQAGRDTGSRGSTPNPEHIFPDEALAEADACTLPQRRSKVETAHDRVAERRLGREEVFEASVTRLQNDEVDDSIVIEVEAVDAIAPMI